MAAESRAGSVWLHGPGLDLALGAGLVYVPIFLLLALAGDAVQRWLPFTLMPLLMLALNAPHLGATLLRVYERREDRQRYAFFALHATGAIALAFVAGLHWPLVGSLLITLYLTVVPWHFTGQNYGIALIFLGRRGVEVPPRVKRLLYASFALSYAMTLLGLHGAGIATVAPVDPSGTAYRFLGLGIPGPLLEVGLLGLSLAWAYTTLESVVRLRERAGWRALGPSLAVLASQALWFAAPILVHFAELGSGRLGPLDPSRYAYTSLWISLTHAVQYLWITTYYAARQAPPTRAAPFLWRALLAGSALYGLPLLLLSPAALGRVPYDAGLLVMLAGALNLHHVLLDGAIWKLRSGPIARILIRGGEGGAQAAGPAERDDAAERAGAGPGAQPPAAAAPRGWLRRGVLASGALGVVLTALGTLEYDFGYRRASERGDLERLETAARRLPWLGRDSPALLARLGTLRAERGDAEGARLALEQSLALHPTATAWLDLGVLRERARDLSGARAAYAEALGLAPELPAALHYAGRVELAAGRRERARALLERAAELDPDSPRLGLLLRRARAGSP